MNKIWSHCRKKRKADAEPGSKSRSAAAATAMSKRGASSAAGDAASAVGPPPAKKIVFEPLQVEYQLSTMLWPFLSRRLK